MNVKSKERRFKELWAYLKRIWFSRDEQHSIRNQLLTINKRFFIWESILLRAIPRNNEEYSIRREIIQTLVDDLLVKIRRICESGNLRGDRSVVSLGIVIKSLQDNCHWLNKERFPFKPLPLAIENENAEKLLCNVKQIIEFELGDVAELVNKFKAHSASDESISSALSKSPLNKIIVDIQEAVFTVNKIVHSIERGFCEGWSGCYLASLPPNKNENKTETVKIEFQKDQLASDFEKLKDKLSKINSSAYNEIMGEHE